MGKPANILHVKPYTSYNFEDINDDELIGMVEAKTPFMIKLDKVNN